MERAVAAFDPDVICGIQSQGFILGAALAYSMKKPFVEIQKYASDPKLPSHTLATKDYTSKWKSFALRKDSFKPEARCAIVDDWIDTGRQTQCAMDLVAQAGGKVVCVAVIHANRNDVSRRLKYAGKLIAMDSP
jgi:adenine phosphoribosyltransferase